MRLRATAGSQGGPPALFCFLLRVTLYVNCFFSSLKKQGRCRSALAESSEPVDAHMAGRRLGAAATWVLARACEGRAIASTTISSGQPFSFTVHRASTSLALSTSDATVDAALNADASRGDDVRGGGRRLAFVDRVHCTAVGGTGGPGCAAFWRSKASGKYGPPDGGNGGRGGDVVIEAVAR